MLHGDDFKSFVDLFVLIISYCIFLSGTGSCISTSPAQVILGYAFDKYRGPVIGLNVAAAGIGIFISGPFFQFCIDRYGVQGSFLIMAGISMQCIAFAALMRPSGVEMKRKEPSTLIANLQNKSDTTTKCKVCSIFRNKMFVVFLVAIAAWCFPLMMVLVHLPNYAITEGSSANDAAFLVTMIGLGSAINRLLTGLTQGPKGLDPVLLYMGFLGILGLMTVTFSLYSSSYVGQLVFSFFIGIYSGGTIALTVPISIHIVGLNNMSTAVGLIKMSAGLGGMFGPIVAGKFKSII